MLFIVAIVACVAPSCVNAPASIALGIEDEPSGIVAPPTNRHALGAIVANP